MTETSAPITGRNSFQTRKVSKALWVAKTVRLPRKVWRGGGGGMDQSVLWGFESCQCFVFSNITEVRSSREWIVSNIYLCLVYVHINLKTTKENFP